MTRQLCNNYDRPTLIVKGAVCNILTVLKQARKERNLFLQNKNATASYSTWKCVFPVGISVFVLVCVIPPTANLPNLYNRTELTLKCVISLTCYHCKAALKLSVLYKELYK